MALAVSAALQAQAVTPDGFKLIRADAHGMLLAQGNTKIEIAFRAPDVVELHAMPDGIATAPGIVIDPQLPAPLASLQVSGSGDDVDLASATTHLHWNGSQLSLRDAAGKTLLNLDPTSLLHSGVVVQHDAGDRLYGINGVNAFDPDAGAMTRTGVRIAGAGYQGNAGAPFVWSTQGWGMLVDATGARFDLQGGQVKVDGVTRPDPRVELIAGTPQQIFKALNLLSGAPQLFPKWAMGFTNSQWGIDQQELMQIVQGYRQRHIPLDNITFDFDWKAWGDDHYGEFRWNQTKFPDADSGRLKQQMDALGVHMTGIMKPRIHVDTEQGRYAQAHGLWSEDVPQSEDYFSHKPVRVLDFDKTATRAWFFTPQLAHSFDTGLVGWWNDEADVTNSNTEFLNMQRALYDGQRAHADVRVWSINRNFYLGSQRYAYGLWSGDILTGFDSMQRQRQRMLQAIDVGEAKWGMDAGGFHGHPSDENYARWIEFAAFVPIARVHGDFGEKRQPWRYGADAEQAAGDALRLRYSLIPYIYSYEHQATLNGLGVVRPLYLDYPNDANVSDDCDAWLFGEGLLVSPVVQQGQAAKDIYLPAGQWLDWFTGKAYQGGHAVHVATDSQHWHDIPLFVREGAIIPTQPAMDYVGQRPLTELTVQMFPASTPSHFVYYDDDGDSYAYEHGVYFSQPIAMQKTADGVQIQLEKVQGSYHPALRDYRLRVHGIKAAGVSLDGRQLNALPALPSPGTADLGYTCGRDRYGDYTELRVPAGQHLALQLRASTP